MIIKEHAHFYWKKKYIFFINYYRQFLNLDILIDRFLRTNNAYVNSTLRALHKIRKHLYGFRLSCIRSFIIGCRSDEARKLYEVHVKTWIAKAKKNSDISYRIFLREYALDSSV